MGRIRWLAIVDLASVTDLDDKHDQFAVAHFVHDAVVADADTQPAALASQCLDAGGRGSVRKVSVVLLTRRAIWLSSLRSCRSAAGRNLSS